MASSQSPEPDFCIVGAPEADTGVTSIERFNKETQRALEENGLVRFLSDLGQLILDHKDCETLELAAESLKQWNLRQKTLTFSVGSISMTPNSWTAGVVPGATVHVRFVLNCPQNQAAVSSESEELPSLDRPSDVFNVTEEGRYRLAFAKRVYTLFTCSASDAEKLSRKYQPLLDAGIPGTWASPSGVPIQLGRPSGTKEPYICLSPALRECDLGDHHLILILECQHDSDGHSVFSGNTICQYRYCPTLPLARLEISRAIEAGFSIAFALLKGESLSPNAPLTHSAVSGTKKEHEQTGDEASLAGLESLSTALLNFTVPPHMPPYHAYFENFRKHPSLKGREIIAFNSFQIPLLRYIKEFGELVAVSTVPCIGYTPGQKPGLTHFDTFGCYRCNWEDVDFVLVNCTYNPPTVDTNFSFIARSKEQSKGIERLLQAVSDWSHPQCNFFTFNQGRLTANLETWAAIKGSTWDEVLLDDETKKVMRDAVGFFSMEAKERYAHLKVQHQRGLILHGPPGNGKTSAIKACVAEAVRTHGVTAIVVENLVCKAHGDEWALDILFGVLKRYPNCMLILEDMDSLVQEHINSAFLNKLDGLKAKHDLLVIGTTNYLGKLHEGLTRPSRFDRFIRFDNPSHKLRHDYLSSWNIKLPDDDCNEIAQMADGLSFAQIKEALLASSKYFVGDEAANFAAKLREQIEALRSGLRATPADDFKAIKLSGE